MGIPISLLVPAPPPKKKQHACKPPNIIDSLYRELKGLSHSQLWTNLFLNKANRNTMHIVCAVHRGIFRRYHEYIGGCSVQKYSGGCSVHWGFPTNSIVFPTFNIISPGLLVISPGVLHRPHSGWENGTLAHVKLNFNLKTASFF